MKTSFCLNCKKEIKYDESKSFGKYCNNTCQGNYTFNNITIPKIESNKCSQAATLKKFLQFKRGYNVRFVKYQIGKIKTYHYI
jgi:DNA gyrase/topoisomerase IV subunit A